MAVAYLLGLPLKKRRPALLGGTGLFVLTTLPLTLLGYLQLVPWLAWLIPALVPLLLLPLDLWVVLGIRKSTVLTALEKSAKGIRAKAEPYAHGAKLLPPAEGKIRVRGLPGLVLVLFSLDKTSKKHALLRQVFRKGIGNVKW